jgi:hypothetical protein
VRTGATRATNMARAMEHQAALLLELEVIEVFGERQLGAMMARGEPYKEPAALAA